MSFPRYPRYKASGVEWLGEVPEGWDLPKLKHFTQFSGGGTPSRDKPKFWGGNIPWVSPKDMKVEDISDAEECITEEGLENSATNLVAPGRVLMVVRSGILKHTIPVAINSVEVALNQDMKAIAFDAEYCEPRFFMRWVQGLNDNLLLEWAKQGATVESIEHAYLANTIVPLPPKAEQATILMFVDRETAKIDALIAEQGRLIALLAEKRQAVISHAVTKGLNPNAPMKASGVEWLGEVPEHWVVVRVGAVFELAQEQGRHDLPVLTVSIHHGVSDKEFDEDEMDRKVTRIEDRTKYQSVRSGDLVYNMMRAWQGGFGAVTVDGLVSPAYVVARPIKDLNTRFVEQQFRTPTAVEEMRRHSYGITDFRLRLYWERFKEIRIALPPLQEQDAILDTVSVQTDRFDTLTAEARRAVALLQERRAALISAAVTGKIDVRGLAARAETPAELDLRRAVDDVLENNAELYAGLV